MRLKRDDRFITVIDQSEKTMYVFRRFCAICGCYIENDRNFKLYTGFMSTFAVYTLLTLIYSIYYYIDNIENIAVIIHHLMLVIDIQYATYYYARRRANFRYIFTEICTSYNYDSDIVNEFFVKVHKQRIKNMSFAYKCVISIAAYTQINMFLFAMVEKYTRGLKYLLLFPCWFPFDLTSIPLQVLAFIWEAIVFNQIGFTIFGASGFIFLVYSYITTQFMILNYAISKSKERAYEMARRRISMSERTLVQDDADRHFERVLRDCYIKGAKMCAEHHLKIIEFYTNIHVTFQLLYFIIFLSGLVVCTCTGFALISNNTALKVKFIGVTVIELIFLYVVCWLGEKVSESSQNIRLSIFTIEWYEMPRECHSTYRLMLERTMKPLVFTTLTGQKVDLENYMSIIKASYSYFNMMLASAS